MRYCLAQAACGIAAGASSAASSRSCRRASSTWAHIAPTKARHMSDCVSQGSPCVPRNASAVELRCDREHLGDVGVEQALAQDALSNQAGRAEGDDFHLLPV